MSILYHHMKLDENFLLDTEADMVVPNDFNYSTYKLDIDHVYDMKDRISDTNTFDVLSAEKNSFEKDRQTFLRIQMDNSSTISRASIFNVLNDFDVNYNNEHILEDINAFVRVYLRIGYVMGYLCMRAMIIVYAIERCIGKPRSSSIITFNKNIIFISTTSSY